MQNKCEKICTIQFFVVPLHPLFGKTTPRMVPSGLKPAERLRTEEREHGENSYERRSRESY